MTDKEISELSARISKKMSLRSVRRDMPQATVTSGFDLEVLRLTERDVKFLTDCGVKVE